MSLFDDFNRSDGAHAINYSDNTYETPEPVMLETGFVNFRSKEEETPMFALTKVQFKLGAKLLYMVVSNNIIAMALDNNHVLRIDLEKAHEVDDIEVTRREEKIHKLFLDPTGKHLVIGLENGENLYLNQKWKKPKPLSKSKGVVIESIAWNKAKGGETSTREILFGSNKGQIFETSIEPTDEFFKKEDKYFKQVYKIDETVPITSLYFEPFPASSRKYAILSTTPNRIYQFIGNIGSGPGPIFESIFSNYLTNPGFIELPSQLPYSELHFFSHMQGIPKYFAWLVEPGIYHGNIVFGSQDTIMDGPTLTSFPNLSNQNNRPISMVLTEFHFVLLYPDRIVCVGRLNQQKVHESFFPPRSGEVQKMAYDSINNTYWAYTTNTIFELVVTKEDRNVWELYLEKKQFETALQYCKDAAQKDKVYTTQADYFFNQNKFQLAANYYALSQKSFEEITLKFINKRENEALKAYLIKKLETFRSQDVTQITLIATWLVEIFLNQMNELHEQLQQIRQQQQQQKDKNVSQQQLQQNQQSIESELKVSQDEFRQFISQDHIKNALNPATTYNLMASHGRVDEMLFFAALIKDFERVITYHFQQGDYQKALVIMSKQPSKELFYKFSPLLMEKIPTETVNVWIYNDLDPKSLIPAIMKYNQGKNPTTSQNQAIRYLQHCVQNQNNKDPVIYNLLLSLYVQQQDDKNLIAFLSNDAYQEIFDLQYALRLCIQNGKTKASILIYSALELYEEAVELSLKSDNLEQAKENANKPEEDEALRKKLWLRIARHVVEKDSDIKEAMAFLKECPLLKIEDILPFFPDFALIDDFKDEICAALEEYNRHIGGLKEEMDDATKSAEAIRMDIRDIRNKYGFVAATAKCNLCSFPILTRQFYLFPCQHLFHSDCLTTEIMKSMTNTQKQRVIDLSDKLQKESSVVKVTTSQDDVLLESNQTRANLDDLIASECVLCGDVMIKSIEKRFIGDNERDVIQSWEL